jgi:ketosteroid isomerase-like protein
MRTPTSQELADREAIREVANRYAHGVDRLDADWMKSAYWPDAIDDHGVFVGNAWEFVDRVMSSHGRWAFTMHTATNHQIELAGDGVSATGELYNVSYLMSADRGTLDTWYGRYLDRYEKRSDEWRIIHRVCVHEGTTSAPITRAMPIDVMKFRQGAFDRSDAGRPIGP